MAKAIKFNLIVDNMPIRNLDDLYENFNIDDILEHFQSGILERWLNVRNYKEKSAEISKLSTENNIETARSLCEIFHQNITESDISLAVYHLENKIKYTAHLQDLKKMEFARQQVIQNYHDGYSKILQSMLDNPQDYPLIKTSMSEIWNQYKQIFLVDYDRFFSTFLSECELSILTMLANSDYRSSNILSHDRYTTLFDKIMSKKNNQSVKIQRNTYLQWVPITSESVFINNIYNVSAQVCIKDNNETEYSCKEAIEKKLHGLMFKSNSVNDSIVYTLESENIRHPFYTYSGETDNYWKDLEQKDKKYMILKMEPGNFVRSCGKSGEELSAEQVNCLFPILDGIDYKSNNASHELLYMEI